MANKRGFEIINGKMYLDGVEIVIGGGGDITPPTPVHNTFEKICIYGTSIESYGSCWGSYLAAKLGLNWGLSELASTTTGVIGFGMGGGGVTWYDHGYPITTQDTTYWGQLNAAFSCALQEKLDAFDWYVEQGKITQSMVDAIVNDQNKRALRVSYDTSIFAQRYIDADLFILGTFGINDRHDWMSFEKDGNTYTSLSMDEGLEFDRRTIFGAYNYVLRQLYARKPNAKVVILGQHCFNWPKQGRVNVIQRAVADIWQIPFADWGTKLRDEMPEFGVKHSDGGIYLADDVHPLEAGNAVLGEWVAKWITDTELTPLNPKTDNLPLTDCPINPAMS